VIPTRCATSRSRTSGFSAAANDLADAQSWEFICECPDVACHTFVTLTVLEFDARRAAMPPLPILAPDHLAA
jgi:hypothetical protein